MASHICGRNSKIYAKHLLGIISGLCSLWLVWDLCLKFFSGSTTIVREQQEKDYLPNPHFLLCKKERFQKDKLEAFGLPDNFFGKPNGLSLNHTGPFPNLNATWQRAAWPKEELQVDWWRYEGIRVQFTKYFVGRPANCSSLTGFYANARAVSVNTLFYGRCYLILAIKNETKANVKGTSLLINLPKDSVANLYIIPRTENIELSAVIDVWNYPVKHFQLHNNEIVRLTFKKEFHVRKPTKSSPCTDDHEETFYKAGLNSSKMKSILMFLLHFSALVMWSQIPT